VDIHTFHHHFNADCNNGSEKTYEYLGGSKMDTVLVQKEVKITLTERELFLIKWSLELMRNTTKDSRLKCDVEDVRSKLSSRFLISEIEKN
jgi:hypothetical protein